MTKSSESAVYAFGSPMTTRIKIGTSISVGNRLSQIQGACPFPLNELWRTPGDHRLEGALHTRFEPLRVHGEWFDFAGIADPVAEIAAAAEVESARLATTESSWTPGGRPDWQPQVSIVQIRGAVLVMPPPSEGGWRCVALSEKRGRQCTRMMDDRALFELPSDWAYWVVPGLGVVEGRGFHFDRDQPSNRSSEELARMRKTLLLQVCTRHVDHEDRLPAAWRPFDLRLDYRLITKWDYSPYLSGVMPGLELLDEEVEDFVTAALSEPFPISLTPEAPDVPQEVPADAQTPMLPPTPVRKSLRSRLADLYLQALGPHLASRRGVGSESAADLSKFERTMLKLFASSRYPRWAYRAVDEALPQPIGEDYRDRQRYLAYCRQWSELSRAVLNLVELGYLQVAQREAWYPGDSDEYEITDAGRAALGADDVDESAEVLMTERAKERP
jgi:hypothetical protein